MTLCVSDYNKTEINTQTKAPTTVQHTTGCYWINGYTATGIYMCIQRPYTHIYREYNNKDNTNKCQHTCIHLYTAGCDVFSGYVN